MTNKLFGRRAERGTTLVMVTIFALAIFGFAALSIDVGRVRYEQRKAHIATDAAAMAGVAMLGTSPDSAISRATDIANANGVISGELSASPLGGVQVGRWDTSTKMFTNDTPYNAVRVAARRTVPLYFGPVVGLRNMGPAVDSVAYLSSGLVPFGIAAPVLSGVASNSQVTLSRDNSGNWGKLNFDNSLGTAKDWMNSFVGGYTGNIGTVTNVQGQQVLATDVYTGIAQLINAWTERQRINPLVVMPVILANSKDPTQSFPNGSGVVYIYAYAVVELLDQNGRSGENWAGNIKFLSLSTSPDTIHAADRRLLVK